MPGEVHALLGENGAGKSTLMKVLAGMHQPDEGRIFIEDQPAVMRTPLEAKTRGVVLIHQELSLAEEMSVAENIYLGELPRKSFGRVDWKTLYAGAQVILDRLNCGFGPKTRVGDLSIANQQMVEIARALTMDAKAVIFDEPTASLTDAEKVVLFDIIRDLKGQGVGIVYISHRMDEIFTLSDRISVLRDGGYPRHAGDRRDQRGRGHPADDRPQPRSVAQHRTCALRRGRASRSSTCRVARSSTTSAFRSARARFWASTAWSAPAGPRSPKRCSGCAGRPRAGSCWTARRSSCTRPATPSTTASRWCPKAARNRGWCWA